MPVSVVHQMKRLSEFRITKNQCMRLRPFHYLCVCVSVCGGI